jgi:glycine/D-amino acid oxidase-like deaminating enzyme
VSHDSRNGDIPDHVDVLIAGGAIMGSAVAWFLTQLADFDGRIVVVERDPSYAQCSTTHSNSCIRQQFSTELNIRISQFTAEFVKTLRARFGGDPRVPNLKIHNFGYLYLASTEGGAATLRANHEVQAAAGVGTRLMTATEIAARYPFYRLEDVVLGSHNTRDEGYWDGSTVFDCMRRAAREGGVRYLQDEVVGLTRNAAGSSIDSVTLASGREVSCGFFVNANGPRAARTAAMAGIELPVEPRKRYSWVFRAASPLDRELPLTIDPTGIHVREYGGGTYLCGVAPEPDLAVDPTDFDMDHSVWMDRVWPALAHRIPAFEAVRVEAEWAGHYAMNTFDRNAIIGAHPEIDNFLFINGFSGHGLQQAPAMGRGLAEWIVHGAYQSLDLAPFGYERIAANRPVIERAVI